MKVLSVFGTRPEAIKMCPLVKELERTDGIESEVCLTSQHAELLHGVTELFGVRADYDLGLMRPGQSLGEIFCGVLCGMETVLESSRPDIVLVHGDTSTSCAAALAAFYKKLPVGHVEAGLRSRRRYYPFPEEMNRRLSAVLSTLHFAPTELNARNLRAEGVTEGVYVTGNTVIDALRTTVREDYRFRTPGIAEALSSGRCVLLTAHRRESIPDGLAGICRAARAIAREFDDIRIIFPVHPNPAVRGVVLPLLQGCERVVLTEPLDFIETHNLLARCCLVMTDSGGLQEEAPAMGVDVLVLRGETERPEAVEAGCARLVGTNEGRIFNAASGLLSIGRRAPDRRRAVSPFGDGHASERIARILLDYGARRAEEI